MPIQPKPCQTWSRAGVGVGLPSSTASGEVRRLDHRGVGREDHRLDHPRVAGAGDRHPPTYYLTRDAFFAEGVLRETSGSSWCEWKGQASYYDLVTEKRVAPKAAWSYLNPSPGFEPIAGAVAVIAGNR